MRTAVGVFQQLADAERAALSLAEVTGRENITVLVPGNRLDVARVPVTEDMAPVAAPMGAALGGALGVGFGVLLFLPGVGPVTAAGLLASALLGVGGAAALAAAGKAADEALSGGIPADELYVYEDALRKGRSVVIANVADGAAKARALEILTAEGAESLDAARESWWVGLRDAEALEYTAAGRSFADDEQAYRRGFEAALDLRARGKSYDDVTAILRQRDPELYRKPAFRRGYERGQEHHARLLAEKRAARAT
jgi:hypothetical protein